MRNVVGQELLGTRWDCTRRTRPTRLSLSPHRLRRVTVPAAVHASAEGAQRAAVKRPYDDFAPSIPPRVPPTSLRASLLSAKPAAAATRGRTTPCREAGPRRAAILEETAESKNEKAALVIRLLRCLLPPEGNMRRRSCWWRCGRCCRSYPEEEEEEEEKADRHRHRRSSKSSSKSCGKHVAGAVAGGERPHVDRCRCFRRCCGCRPCTISESAGGEANVPYGKAAVRRPRGV